MPTPVQTFALVAYALGAVDPNYADGVCAFYELEFAKYPESVRELVSEFIIGQTGVPSTENLTALRAAVGEETGDDASEFETCIIPGEENDGVNALITEHVVSASAALHFPALVPAVTHLERIARTGVKRRSCTSGSQKPLTGASR